MSDKKEQLQEEQPAEEDEEKKGDSPREAYGDDQT